MRRGDELLLSKRAATWIGSLPILLQSSPNGPDAGDRRRRSIVSMRTCGKRKSSPLAGALGEFRLRSSDSLRRNHRRIRGLDSTTSGGWISMSARAGNALDTPLERLSKYKSERRNRTGAPTIQSVKPANHPQNPW